MHTIEAYNQTLKINLTQAKSMVDESIEMPSSSNVAALLFLARFIACNLT
jgi:hypothetical protein